MRLNNIGHNGCDRNVIIFKKMQKSPYFKLKNDVMGM